MAEISIIVPVYKVENYLKRCVDSILNQTYTDFELILVDDGSPDRCGEMCEKYAKQDSRIIVLHRKNGGLSAARNTGLDWVYEHSESQYLTFADSDDWIHPQYLELLKNAIEGTKASASVCCQSRTNKYDKSKLEQQYDSYSIEELHAEELLTGHEWNFNYAWGKLYRREFFRTVRYPEGKNFEDTFTTYKVLYAGKSVVWISAELYFYYINEEGISKSPWQPSELVIFDGMKEQMEFYRLNGYQKALAKEEQLYVNHFAYQICRIRENRKDYSKNRGYIKKLKSEMMTYVHKYPEKYGYHQMPQCYDAAYPNIMKIYHNLGIVIHRIIK